MPILFYKTNEKYGCFSNFSAHPIYTDAYKWPTSEHYYQAHKFNNGNDRQDILDEPSPMKAALIGRDRNRQLIHNWEEIKIDVMRKAVWCKVLQNIEVYTELISTKNEEIIEHTNNDSFWADGGDGKGKNWLGKIYMEIRSSIYSINEQFTDNDFREGKRDIIFPLNVAFPDVEGMFWNMGFGEEKATEHYKFTLNLTEQGTEKYTKIFEDFRINNLWINA